MDDVPFAILVILWHDYYGSGKMNRNTNIKEEIYHKAVIIHKRLIKQSNFCSSPIGTKAPSRRDDVTGLLVIDEGVWIFRY